MFIKLTGADFQSPLLLDIERIVSVTEMKNDKTRIEYAQPKGTGTELVIWYVQETAEEILELIEEKQGANL